MIPEQVRRNAVALISLVVALGTLLYTTWRNEETEDNWNTRVAGFEMLTTLGELQRIVYLNHYDGDLDEGSPRKGWVRVMVLRDLGEIMPEPLPGHGQRMLEVWEKNWAGIGKDQAAVDRVEAAIDATREAILQVLRALR
jgi:hypothetical protein